MDDEANKPDDQTGRDAQNDQTASENKPDNVENFLEEIAKDNPAPSTTPFDDMRLDDPSDSLPEKKEETETPAGEDKKTEEKGPPFHTHPRFKKITSENRELKEKLEKLENRLEEKLESGKEITDADIPPWLKTLMGDNPALYQQFAEYQNNLVSTVIRKVNESNDSVTERKKKEQDKWNQWVQDEFDTLRDEGEKFNQEEVAKIALDLDPRDENGNVSIRKSLEIWKEKKELEKLRAKKPEVSHAKKQISSQTMKGGGAAPSTKTVLTAQDIKGRSLTDMINNNY